MIQIQWKLDRNRKEVIRKARAERNGLSVRFVIEEDGKQFSLTLGEIKHLLDLAERYKNSLRNT